MRRPSILLSGVLAVLASACVHARVASPAECATPDVQQVLTYCASPDAAVQGMKLARMRDAALRPDAAPEEFPVPTAGSPSEGPLAAPVVVTVFTDLQCPFCARLHPSLEKLRTAHPGEVRLVWKHYPLPFHPRAKELARAAQAAGEQGKLFAFATLAFDRQRDLAGADLSAWAEAAGCDRARFERDLAQNGARYDAEIERDIALGNKIGVRGTPHSFVNGMRIPGAVPYEKLDEAVAANLTATAALSAAGVPREEAWWRLTAAGYEPPAAVAKREEAKPKDDKPRVVCVPIGQSPQRGARASDALVTIVEFSDFQCPFCRRANETLAKVLENHGDVRLVYKHNPLEFHAQARPAALAAAAAARQGQARFWTLHDLLFAENLSSPEQLQAVLSQAGFGAADLAAAREDPVARQRVDEDIAAARDAGANGTPTFFVNGVEVVGAQPLEKFEEVVTAQLAAAKKRQAATGEHGDTLYAGLCAENTRR
jgi:protein-disulfide isomerase